MKKASIILIVILLAVAVFKISAQKAPIAVSPLARVSVSDVYDEKKYPNPFMTPQARQRAKAPPREVKKAVIKKLLILDEPTLDSLRLTGIMLSGSEKQALLYDLNTRQTYFLIRGKLYDRDVKVVHGFKGEVLSQSVVLEKGNKKKTIALPEAMK